MSIDAFHLPGLREDDVAEWSELRHGDVVLRVPRLHAGALAPLLDTMMKRAAGRLPVARRVAAIDAVARRLQDPGDPLRRTAEHALCAVTGYAPATIREGLDRMAAEWRAPVLEALLDAELGGGAVLDQFVTEGGRTSRAMPPRLAFHVFSGNVPGVAVTSLVRSLLVGGACIGKTASGEPVLAPLFARAMAEHDPELGARMAVTWWPGGDEDIERDVLERADVVVVYGSGATLDSLRRRAAPHARVVDHGPRLSVGFIGGDALADPATATPLADAAARAVATFDQQGCVSPHAIYVQAGGGMNVDAFADMLHAALARLQIVWPRAPLTAGEATAVRDYRARAEFAALRGEDVVLLGRDDEKFTVVRHGTGRPFEAACLSRTIDVRAFDDLADALDDLQRFRPLLQSAAVAGLDASHVARIADAGFTRITTFDALPWPQPLWHHDGRGSLQELVRWVDVEAGAG